MKNSTNNTFKSEKESVPAGHFLKDVFLPFFLWILTIVIFSNAKDIHFGLLKDNGVSVRYFFKFLMTILLPLALIFFVHKEKAHFGVYFQNFSNSFKIALRSYGICGPAGMSFPLIAYLGWSFSDWLGAITISFFYTIALLLVPRVTLSLPTNKESEKLDKKIFYFFFLSVFTVIISFSTYQEPAIFTKILYYLFIVGFGEELFFRGYIQSSFNKYFGKPFSIANVNFGWGLILSALLFGLIHALVVFPPVWPWASFPFISGLIFGFIREKDGSLLSVILLHALMDMPLAFIN